MAQEYGAKLLGEVEMCTLAETLAILRNRRQPEQRRWTGIEFLDDLVDAFAAGHPAPRTTAQQYGVSPRVQASPRAAPTGRQLQYTTSKPPVIEITSTSPASGKTELLYHLAANYLLGSQPSPPSSTSTSVPAPSSSPTTIIYLDLTSRFSPTRLLTHLKSALSTRPFTDPSSADPESAKAVQIHTDALAALDHIHVFKPQTAGSFAATLTSLKPYLLDVKAHFSGGRALGAILISDLSAFYWQDRHDAEVERVSDIGSRGLGQQRDGVGAGAAAGAEARAERQGLHRDVLLMRWREVVQVLRDLQRVFECPVIGTNMALLKVQRTRDGVVVPSHLPGAWNGFVDVRVVLGRERERYEETISAEEVLARQKGRRKEAMESVSRVRVNMWKCDEWEGLVRDRVEEVMKKTRWKLVLGENGLMMNKAS